MSDKRLWKEGNVFIVNLAVADLCVTGTRIPLQKNYRLYSNHQYRFSSCKGITINEIYTARLISLSAYQ